MNFATNDSIFSFAIAIIQLPQKIGKMTPELCDEIFDADYDTYRFFHNGLSSYETDIYEAKPIKSETNDRYEQGVDESLDSKIISPEVAVNK